MAQGREREGPVTIIPNSDWLKTRQAEVAAQNLPYSAPPRPFRPYSVDEDRPARQREGATREPTPPNLVYSRPTDLSSFLAQQADARREAPSAPTYPYRAHVSKVGSTQTEATRPPRHNCKSPPQEADDWSPYRRPFSEQSPYSGRH